MKFVNSFVLVCARCRKEKSALKMKNKKFFNLANITPKEALKVLKENKDGFLLHTDNEKLLKALEYAIEIIESYELDCRDLEGYIKDGNDIDGFCQGSIYKKAIKKIKEIAGIK